jgi:hypothetical protein
MSDLAAGSRVTDPTNGKQATAGKPGADASHNRDHRQPRDVAPPAAPAAAGYSAFAALASSFPEPSTTPASSDAGSFMRQQLRGVEAMMGGQRRTHSGALTSPSGLSDHDGLLVERAASSSSTHRALLGGSSPERPAVPTAGLLNHPERNSVPNSSRDGNTMTAADSAPAGDAVQQHQAGVTTAGGEPRRPGGVARPTVVIPSPPAAVGYFVPMASPTSGLVQPYSAGAIPIDEIDLDVIDDIAGVDACSLSTSSSPTISGAVVGRTTPGGHLRSSRDHHDLRRAALLNMQLLSPSMQQGAHISAAGGGADISISVVGGPMPSPPMMFTGPTRDRACPGSNNSLQSAGSGAEQLPSTEPMDALQMLQTLRMSAGSTPSPAPNGSPARPPSRSAAATPRTGMAGGSRTSSAAGSPVPPPSHGAAAALLAGNVVPSPRTPHSPLSVILSPRPGSARVASGQGTPLPGPLFGSGFNVLPVGTSPGTSPATSSVAASNSSTVSSCCTGSGAGVPAGMQPPAAAGGHSRFRSPTPTAGAGADAQQQQGEAAPQQPTHQQLLRQQVLSHDTRYGPHGGSPLSPSHHHQQLPPRADVLLSPTCPTPLVPPALTSAGSHIRLVAESAAAGAAPAPGAAAGSRSVGGVGQLSIHEWLDHQSRMLPYEVPQGLRDAADLRDAVAQEQQHLQSRMGPGRGTYSQRSSLSNLDSPGGLLHGSGASTGPGRFPAAAGGHVHAGVPVHPALHTLQEAQYAQTHSHSSQVEPSYGQLSIGLAGGGWGAAAGTQHTCSEHGAAAGGATASAAPCIGLGVDTQGSEQQVQQHAGGQQPSSNSSLHTACLASSSPQYWGNTGPDGPSPAAPGLQGSSISTPVHAQGSPLLTDVQPACVLNACPHADPGQGHVHACQPLLQSAGRRDVAGSSSQASRPTAVQLGAGSHTYPARSPVQQGNCCCSGQHASGDVQLCHACSGNTTDLGSVAASSSSSSLGGRGADGRGQAAGRVLCAPLDVRDYQQPAVPLTWRQLQGQQLVSPTGHQAADAPARVPWQQAQLDQHVLPGIAELLHRRRGLQQHSQPPAQGSPPQATSGRCSTAGLHAESLPAAARLIKGHPTALDPVAPARSAAAADAAVCDAAAEPADAAASVRSSRDGCTAACHKAAATAPACAGDTGGGSSHCGSNVTLAELLHDDRFVGSILSDLPGVNPQSDIVRATVAELQEALSAEQGTAAQQRMQLL